MIREKFWPVAWLMLAAVIIGASIGLSARANAIVIYPRITITVVWTGDPQCIRAWAPAGGDDAKAVALCSPDQWWSESYQAPAVGGWVGLDPEMSGAESMSCTLSVNGDVVIDDFAVRGDGHELTCLGRW